MSRKSNIGELVTNTQMMFMKHILGNNKYKAYIPLQRKIPGVGGWRWLSPPTPLFCDGDTNMLVSENAKICISPDAKPQHQPVEYRLLWVPGVRSFHWACTFHIFCVDFICVG